MRYYKNLNKQEFVNGDFKIVPIRDVDKFEIMKWRNEQIYHLRQKTKLTKIDQQNYFKNIIEELFDIINPNQILFSFLKNDECIGYGGLVHINWIDKNAEISFVMNTDLENNFFHKYWTVYLNLIEKVAFNELRLNKIFVYAFDLRPKLYEVLNNSFYNKEARLKKHHKFNKDYVDVLIYSKFNKL